MYSLLQSKRIRGSAGDPLPEVFKSFTNIGIQFLRGQYCLTAAGAGTGKSILWLTVALRSKVPTLYLSADSDAFTQYSRSLSVLSGMELSKSMELARTDGLTTAELDLAGIPIRFGFDASPSLDAVETQVEAYEEVYGEYPALIIVDNITNVRAGGENDSDPFSGLEGLNDYLHDMARNTGSFVAGLHHVTGPYNDADKPIPLSGVKGQISRVPELILTGFRPTENTVGWSVVKNRGGKADPSGNLYAELEFEGSRMQIRDQRTTAQFVNEVPENFEERIMYEQGFGG